MFLARVVALLLLPTLVHAEPRRGRAGMLNGDAIIVDGVHVRLKGVAAPERNEPGGPEATAFMRRLIDGRHLVCDLTNEVTRKRRVGWCYLEGQDIRAAIIRAGLARSCPRYDAGGPLHETVAPGSAQPAAAGVLCAEGVGQFASLAHP